MRGIFATFVFQSVHLKKQDPLHDESSAIKQRFCAVLFVKKHNLTVERFSANVVNTLQNSRGMIQNFMF